MAHISASLLNHDNYYTETLDSRSMKTVDFKKRILFPHRPCRRNLKNSLFCALRRYYDTHTFGLFLLLLLLLLLL